VNNEKFIFHPVANFSFTVLADTTNRKHRPENACVIRAQCSERPKFTYYR
jgi:hypothetical protein